MYADKALPESHKIMYNWEEVYYSKKITDDKTLPEAKRKSEKYKAGIMKEIVKYGITSMFIQTQYYVSFSSQGTRFTTIEMLREGDNPIFKDYRLCENDEDIRISINKEDKEHIYFVVGGIDPATTNDYAAFAVGVAKVRKIDREVVDYQLKAVKIMNPELKKITPETLISRCAELCSHYMVDMVMVDSSADQEDRAYYLRKKLIEIQCDTMVIPFSYANQNKFRMMRVFEESLIGGKVSFPSEDETSKDEYYKEFIDELLYFQKIVSKDAEGKTKIKFEAPQSEGFYDDMVCAVAQSNYLCYYIRYFLLEKKVRTINLGDGISYKLDYHKNSYTKAFIKEEFGRNGRTKGKAKRIGCYRM